MHATQGSLSLIVAVMVMFLASCADDFPGSATALCPSEIDFEVVSAVAEKRCGTLDCHGALTRPLKIYGRNGLRFLTQEEVDDPTKIEPNETYPGGKATTATEHEFNRRSMCGVEPEKTTAVVRGELEPSELLLLRKPLEEEDHKGGPLFLKGGAGAVCVESWLAGDVNVAECNLANANL